jgi:hypothetical protein
MIQEGTDRRREKPECYTPSGVAVVRDVYKHGPPKVCWAEPALPYAAALKGEHYRQRN